MGKSKERHKMNIREWLKKEIETHRNQGNAYVAGDDKLASSYCNGISTICDVLLTQINSGEIQTGVEWKRVEDEQPPYIKTLKESRDILILDNKKVYTGKYVDGKFQFWIGSWCNTDCIHSQRDITHWAVINLPEAK
jgi:hypothetical protein